MGWGGMFWSFLSCWIDARREGSPKAHPHLEVGCTRVCWSSKYFLEAGFAEEMDVCFTSILFHSPLFLFISFHLFMGLKTVLVRLVPFGWWGFQPEACAYSHVAPASLVALYDVMKKCRLYRLVFQPVRLCHPSFISHVCSPIAALLLIP
jgi:hypothetical protein